jgi:hypothetical protein
MFSPDGATVAAIQFSSPQDVLLYPIGTGASRSLGLGNLRVARHPIAWFPDGKHLAIVGSLPGASVRTFDLDLATGKLQPLGPADFQAKAIASDGNRMAGITPAGPAVWNRATNQTTAIAGIAPQETIDGWSSDGKGLMLTRDDPGVSTGTFLDLATGQRSLLKTINMQEKAGTLIGRLLMADDKKSYAYWQRTANSALWVLDGVK